MKTQFPISSSAVTMIWLGQAGFLFSLPSGRVVLLDPYLSDSVYLKSKEQSGFAFKRMAAEKAFFEENIIKNLKPANWASVAKQRRDWIAAEASTKTPILDCDRETWKKILAVAASLVK